MKKLLLATLVLGTFLTGACTRNTSSPHSSSHSSTVPGVPSSSTITNSTPSVNSSSPIIDITPTISPSVSTSTHIPSMNTTSVHS